MRRNVCMCRRNMQGASEDDVDIPSATNTALTWAFFMGTSANVRYQVLRPSGPHGCRPVLCCIGWLQALNLSSKEDLICQL